MGAPENIQAAREAEEKMLIALAGRIAAGMCANPAIYKMNGWQREVSFNAVQVARRVVQAVREGV